MAQLAEQTLLGDILLLLYLVTVSKEPNNNYQISNKNITNSINLPCVLLSRQEISFSINRLYISPMLSPRVNHQC